MEKWDCCGQSQGHGKFQNVNKCLSRWYLLNRWTFYYQAWFGYASLWARLFSEKDWFAILKVKVIARAHMIKLWHFLLYILTANPVATKLCLRVHHHKPECLIEKLDSCVHDQAHSKISKCYECLSRSYHLNRCTFYKQTCYGNASFWARLSSEEIDLLSSRSSGLLSSRSRSQWRTRF